jgi:hypothetical protein
VYGKLKLDGEKIKFADFLDKSTLSPYSANYKIRNIGAGMSQIEFTRGKVRLNKGCSVQGGSFPGSEVICRTH